MEQFKKLLADLSIMQRVTIVAAALVVGAGIFSFVRWKRESDFRPLTPPWLLKTPARWCKS
jgi:hypothetical protein